VLKQASAADLAVVLVDAANNRANNLVPDRLHLKLAQSSAKIDVNILNNLFLFITSYLFHLFLINHKHCQAP